MALLVDTGILYALADADDDWHERARTLLERRETFLVPVTVLPEAAYLVHERLGPHVELELVRSFVRGELALEPLTAADLRRSGELLERYPSIGFVDASVVAVAERLGLERVATTDRRDFGRVRPRHCERFELLPE